MRSVGHNATLSLELCGTAYLQAFTASAIYEQKGLTRVLLLC